MTHKWKGAPRWAMWLAMDQSGRWWWHSRKPELRKDTGLWVSDGICRQSCISDSGIEFDLSLECRP